MIPIIQTQDLSYQYQDGTAALTRVNISIFPGEFVAIIGGNGSGKTTLGKCLNGLFKPSGGSVIVDGFDTKQIHAERQVLKTVGYVFQNPDHQLFNATVWDEIAFGAKNIGTPPEILKELVEEAARVTGISQNLFDEHPHFLSKGLRQRVAIATIIAMQPKVLIVDEPTTGQDFRQSQEVMAFLRNLQNKGHAILVITHEMNLVAQFATRTIVMHNGTVLLNGLTRDVMSSKLLKCAAIRPPQITQIAERLAPLGLRPSLLVVSEFPEAFREVCGQTNQEEF